MVKIKWYWYLLASLILLSIGFFIGRANQKTVIKTEIEYVKGEPIKGDSIPYPVPVEVVKHDIKYLPSKKDTVWKDGKIVEVVKKIDTASIIKDYMLENKYENVLINNDTVGKFTVRSAVQFNKLKYITGEVIPVQKVVTNTVVKKNTFTPFLSASYNTFNQAGAGGGVFIKNIGFEYKYLKNINNFKSQAGHEFGIKLKL